VDDRGVAVSGCHVEDPLEWPLRSRGRRRETSWRLPTGRLSVKSKAEVDYKTDRDEVPTSVIPECVNQGGS